MAVHSRVTPRNETFRMDSIWAGGLRMIVLATYLSVSTAAFAQAIAGGEPAFDILEYQIEGNTVLSTQAIEQAVTPFLGEGKRIADAEAARAALEKVYQSAGYVTVFVDLPEQRVEEGIVRLAVIEGRISRLIVSGSRYFSQGYIRDKVSELAEQKVPNFNEVQRELAVVNRTDDRRVQPVMRAGSAPGTVEVELKVEDRLPASGTLELNNRHASNTTPWRLAASVRYDNLFQREHSIVFNVSTAPAAPSQSSVLSLNYSIPRDDQSTWVAYVVNSNSNVAALGTVDVVGKGTVIGLRYARPLVTSPRESHTVTLGVDYKMLEEETRSGDNVISTPLRYLPFSVAYSGTFDHGNSSNTSLNLQMFASFRPVLQRDVNCVGFSSDQFECKRYRGDGGFATVRGDLRHTLALGSGRLQGRLGGQIATGPVPSGEQYVIGGAETIRGYLEAEGAGDGAVLGSLEWRSRDFTWTPFSEEAPGREAWPVRLGAVAFADVARAYTFDPATGQPPWASLAGIGAGIRIGLRKTASGELDLAWPVKSTAATQAWSPRLHVRFTVEL
jgi:hemolysin activation/secretion protein